ncbi:MAG: transpeptidase [Rickettsiales bacterium]|nr:transpeptidase [Rickettsiales bacterium]|tara:strand:- start:378 stop:887 length:510 start_codon:yes stop_codon:yes gene_type:complete
MNLFVKKSHKKNITYVWHEKKKFICFVGKNGIGFKKREGDLITPKGRFKLIKIFYKKKELNQINTIIPKVEIKKNFAWCTDSRNKKYNSLISKPYGCEYEDLFRKDNLYDIFIILDFNYNSPIKYKGSAIFLHCSESKTKFTEGCIAMSKKDLLKLIPHITSSSNLIIN